MRCPQSLSARDAVLRCRGCGDVVLLLFFLFLFLLVQLLDVSCVCVCVCDGGSMTSATVTLGFFSVFLFDLLH